MNYNFVSAWDRKKNPHVFSKREANKKNEI